MQATIQNNNLLQALKSFTVLSQKERALFLNVAGGQEKATAIKSAIIEDVPSEEFYYQLILRDHQKKALKNIKKYKNTRGISKACSN